MTCPVARSGSSDESLTITTYHSIFTFFDHVRLRKGRKGCQDRRCKGERLWEWVAHQLARVPQNFGGEGQGQECGRGGQGGGQGGATDSRSHSGSRKEVQSVPGHMLLLGPSLPDRQEKGFQSPEEPEVREGAAAGRRGAGAKDKSEASLRPVRGHGDAGEGCDRGHGDAREGCDRGHQDQRGGRGV